MTIKNIINLKYLFCFFVSSTKMSYSSSKIVLMFFLYVFSYKNVVKDIDFFFVLNETVTKL